MRQRAILIAFLATISLHAQTAAEIEALLARIAPYQYGADPAASVELDEIMGRLSGSPEKRRMAETLLLKFVQSSATPAGKESAFRQLSLVGSNASIPVLAPLIDEPRLGRNGALRACGYSGSGGRRRLAGSAGPRPERSYSDRAASTRWTARRREGRGC